MKTFEIINGMWTINSAAGGLDCLLHKIMITACEQDDPKAAQSTLKHGLNPKNRLITAIKKDDWMNYIHIAAIIGSLRVMKILAANVDLNMPSSENCTALEYALLHNHPSLVQFLLENGANANSRGNSQGFSPLHTACFFTLRPKNQNNIMSIMLAQSSYRMIYDINPENVKMLLDNGADVHYTDNYSNTAVIAAIISRSHFSANASSYDSVVALLLDAMEFKITGPPHMIASPKCPICLSVDQADFCHLDCCQHSYHVNCLQQWFSKPTSNKKCPTCRSPLKSARPVTQKLL